MATVNGQYVSTSYDPSKYRTYQDYLNATKRTQQQEAIQQPYNEAAPSPAASGGAAGTANTNTSSIGLGYNVDPYGYTSYNNQGAQDRLTLETQARLQAEAEQRRLKALQDLSAQFHTSTPTALPPRVQHDPAGDEAAARAAAFARAKDQTGALAASQMRSVGDIMAARGVAGSPIEGLKMAGVLGGARGNLDNVVSEQLIQDLNRAREVADLTYTGNITQRGQDINQPNNQMKLAMLGLFSQLF